MAASLPRLIQSLSNGPIPVFAELFPAIPRLVKQRWAIENLLHWPRDTQIGEGANCCSQQNNVQMLDLLRTLALNLLRFNVFTRSGVASWP